jgi:hypothetical protein
MPTAPSLKLASYPAKEFCWTGNCIIRDCGVSPGCEHERMLASTTMLRRDFEDVFQQDWPERCITSARPAGTLNRDVADCRVPGGLGPLAPGGRPAQEKSRVRARARLGF